MIFPEKDLLQIYAWTGQPDNLYSPFSPLSLPPGSRVMFESIFDICYHSEREIGIRCAGIVWPRVMFSRAALLFPLLLDMLVLIDTLILHWSFLFSHHMIFMQQQQQQQQCLRVSRVWSYRGQDAIKNVAFPHYSQRDLIIKVNGTLGRRFV